jgi:hypothetical protein
LFDDSIHVVGDVSPRLESRIGGGGGAAPNSAAARFTQRVMTWRGFPQQDFPAIFLAMVFLLRRFTCAKEVVWMRL